jgi:hypothetical protein
MVVSLLVAVFLLLFQKKATGNRMAPRFWLCDFDLALRKAISTVFPESACFGDLWHFYYILFTHN